MDSPTATPPPAPLADQPAHLRQRLLDWYDTARRDLPWRARPGEVADPWAVLVSEIMLQQTTVATVTPRFAPFLARFPTPAAMAEAPLDAVLHAWQGLGYYRRARGLHAAAVAIVQQHGGEVPRGSAELRRLPGIGAYTAAAVAAIAMAEPVVPVDGNVARVLARLVAHARPISPTKAEFQAIAASLAASERACDLAQALMELGALVCRPKNPACAHCPWATACRAHALEIAGSLPVREAKPPRPTRFATAMLILDDEERICFRRRPDQGLLAGLIELPTTALSDRPYPSERAILAGLPKGRWHLVPGRVRHVFSHFALELVLTRGVSHQPLEGGFFHARQNLAELALPTLTRKLLAHAGIKPDP